MLEPINNSMCSECRQAVPVLYCTCQGAKSFLCNTCISAHTFKFPQYPHPLAPVAVDNVDFSAFDLRTKRVAEGKAELQRNLDAIDSCCNELSAAVDTLKEQLVQLRDQWLQHLYQWKSQLKQDSDEAVAEVEKTILEETPIFTAKYSQALRNYQTGKLVLFTYRIDMSGIQSNFESFVKANLSDAFELQPPSAQEQQASASFYSSIETPMQQSQFQYISTTVQPNSSPSSYPIFTTIQPEALHVGMPTSGKAPEPHYGFGQLSAPRPPQSFQAPGTSACPACNKSFRNEGGKRIYCSTTCNPNKLNPAPVPTTGNIKECAKCKKYFVHSQFFIPPDLQEYVRFASSVCSLNCFREFAAGRQASCSGCGLKGDKESFALQLQCGHGFHSKDCLFSHLIETTRAFTYSTQLSCDRCRQQFHFGLVFQAINKGEFANRQKELMELVCSTCGSYDIRQTKTCMHYSCNEHPRSSCYFCNPCYQV